MTYPIASIGTGIALVAGFAIYGITAAIIRRGHGDDREQYMHRINARLVITIAVALAIAVLWARLLQNKGTFFGLIGAGLAVAMKEPLLSIAGRLSIWLGHLYRVGDRIEFQGMGGDVINIGVFYTRMLEIGNWIHGDQATGRIVQFPNSAVYQNSVYNYTQNFSFIWDELTLPVTYASDVPAATEILVTTGKEYTRDFLSSAQGELDKLRNDAVVPDLNLEPTVYTKVTSNYVELTMRYLVEPRKRRQASSWLYQRIFEKVCGNERISIGSDTMDLTVHGPGKKEDPQTGDAPAEVQKALPPQSARKPAA
ncbi:MAG TPA: mechanosensitive ion channel domain-containing protein [Acidobacteriaceae bacterium]|nr:mechanosensitive ion channel domain-containing protein [Acidobacteriaceae bacterium]